MNNLENINQIAIFIDLDNLEIQLQKDLNIHFEPVLVKSKCQELGRIRHGAVYCDFRQLNNSSLRDKFAMEGFDLVDLPSLGISQKNSADIKIAVDAISLAYESNDIDTIVFVTGDADFNPILKALRKIGRTIIVIGLQVATASILKTNCDRFIAYDELLNLPSIIVDEDMGKSIRVSEEGERVMPRKFQENILKYAPTFKRAYDACEEKNGQVLAAQLKPMLVQLDPAFSEKRFGYSSFKEFLTEFKKLGYIALNQPNPTGPLGITWVGK